MAQGDVIFFEEALASIIEGGWEPADDIKCAILDNTLAPQQGDSTPTLSDYTEVGTGGTYVAGGESLGDLQTCVTQTGTTMKFDSATNPTWAQDPGNDSDAYWGLVYHVASGIAICFVELGGPVDMKAGDLTITWHGSGIFTIAM